MRRQPSTCALGFPTAARGCAHLRRTRRARTHTHTQAGSLARALAYASPPARPRARYGRARTPVPTLRPVGPSPRPSAASSPPSCPPCRARDHGLVTLVTARTAAPRTDSQRERCTRWRSFSCWRAQRPARRTRGSRQCTWGCSVPRAHTQSRGGGLACGRSLPVPASRRGAARRARASCREAA